MTACPVELVQPRQAAAGRTPSRPARHATHALPSGTGWRMLASSQPVKESCHALGWFVLVAHQRGPVAGGV